ncbi:MAG: protease complex subunit PrcB family protein [Clostridiales bacterium]|nr:protease complex subunit PrcB family protein [Clostridiales bacterium]
MKTMYKKITAITFIIILCLSCIGCSKGSNNVKKLKDLEFTVVQDADLPEKLSKFIEEKKVNPCKFTYSNEDYLYIVQGYGTQKSGGYSISVNDLYLTENAIYIKTNLIGPGKDDPVSQSITYPYIVVKIEYMDKPVVFE